MSHLAVVVISYEPNDVDALAGHKHCTMARSIRPERDVYYAFTYL